MFNRQLTATATLRPIAESDAAAHFAVIDASRDHLRRWLPFIDGSRSEADSADFIRYALEVQAAGTGMYFAILADGELAGVIGYHNIDRDNRIATVGCWLGTAYQGRGLAHAAYRAVIEIAFEELGLNRVQMFVSPDNDRSNRAKERLGMTREGLIRAAEWLYDRYVDHCIWSILADEWRERKEQGRW